MGTPAPEPERVLAGRYRLEARLGKGGMGAIWRAEHLALQAPVAVKLIDRDTISDEETVTRFLREAKAAAALRSPHVVQILDYGMDEGVPFIVMELLEGETLSQRIRRLGRLSPQDTARIVTHVGRAIGRAHEANIIHRDLKPENVFLVHNEDEEVAKVLDFGVAKVNHGALGEGTQTRTGSILGTPYYMSPEQAQGNKTVDYRSDLWSLAVIAFECMTGKRPFFSDGLGDLVLQICVRDLPIPSQHGPVPLGFDSWFARAVSRDPEQRFQSAREMTDALREALGLDPREGPSVGHDLAALSRNPQSREYRLSTTADPSAPTLALEADQVQRLAESGRVETQRESLASDPEQPRKASPVPAVRGSFPQARGSEPSAPDIDEPRHVVTPSRSDPPVRRHVLSSVQAPSSGLGMGTIVAVAAAALALGLGGGLVALRQVRDGQRIALPSWFPDSLERVAGPIAKEPPEVLRPKAKPRPSAQPKPVEILKEEPEEEGSQQAVAPAPSSLPSGAPSASPSSTTSSAPRASTSSTSRPFRSVDPDELPPTGSKPNSKPESDSHKEAAPAPSGSVWVKPAWAVPDEEPRRAPDLMQDEDSKE